MLVPQLNACRDLASLDGIWDFRLQRTDEDASGWENGFVTNQVMAVPSSFNDLLVRYSDRNHWGFAWYTRSFEIPRAWADRRVVLHFGAVNYSADVWINGRLLGSHETGYTPFEFELNSALVMGRNRIVVRVNTRLTADTVPQGEVDNNGITGWGANYPPGNFDFFTYAGLHRPVSLYTTAPDHLDRILVDSVVGAGAADVRFRVRTRGGDRVRIRVEETGQTALSRADGETELNLRIETPRIWDVDHPELYHATVELLRGDEVLDVYTMHFGIRSIAIEGERLLLNGRPIYFRGFGRHEDFFLVGKGNQSAVNVRDLELLKWIGANSFRTAHYPCSEEMLDLADRFGFLVISESPAVTIVPDKATARTLATHCAAQQEYMLRDYNHPSVVMWSIANEPISHQASARPYFQKIVAAARAVDPARPLMLVTCFGDRDVCLDLVDVIGINSYPGWYWGGGAPFEQTMKWLEDFLHLMHRHAGGKPLVMTEFGADALPGVHNLPPELWTEEYQADLIRNCIAVIRRVGFLSGEHVWAFADFRTGQNYTRAYGNHKGVFTRDRQPKRAAYALREIWRT